VPSLPVVSSMFIHAGMLSSVPIPVVPRPPVAMIEVLLPFMIIRSVMTLPIGAFSVSMVIAVITIGISRNQWESYGERKKEKQYGGYHPFHRTPPWKLDSQGNRFPWMQIKLTISPIAWKLNGVKDVFWGRYNCILCRSGSLPGGMHRPFPPP
jgi:hypothetical protein